jgi:hypothetical protein
MYMAATDVRSASRRASGENHDDENWQFALAVTFCYRMQRPGRGALVEPDFAAHASSRRYKCDSDDDTCAGASRSIQSGDADRGDV